MHKKSIYTEIQWDSLVDHITEVHGLTDPTTQGIIERMNDYVVALREDKYRLDWLLKHVICAYEQSWHPKDTEYLTSREEIDEAMGG